MRALLWRGEEGLAVVSCDPPASRPGWALVAPSHVGLCGTDLHICAGTHPRARAGLVIGHEFVGRLLDPVGPLSAGQAVFVNPLLPCGACAACASGLRHACERLELLGIDRPGGAAEQALVPAGSLTALPDGLPLERAALIEPLAVAVRAVRRSGLMLSDDVHVVGAGPIGLLVALCARAAGAARVTVSEPSAERRRAAAELGLEPCQPAPHGRRADVVFDSTGNESAAPTLARWARTGGRIVVVGVHHGPVAVDLRSVTFDELTIIGSRVYTDDDVGAAISLLASGSFPAEGVVSAIVDMGAAAEAVERMRAGLELKVLVRVEA